MTLMTLHLRAMLVAAFTIFTLAAQTTVAVPCDRDNTLYEDTGGNFSNGIGESVFVGVTAQGKLRRALLHFDVAAVVPAGARIVAATLTMNVIASGALSTTTIDGHRLTEPWGEGTSDAIAGGGGMGAPSTAGDATWLHRFYPAVTWANVGGDFEAAPSLQMTMPSLGPVVSEPSAASTADVQAWLDQPGQNHGWLLKARVETLADSRARRLDSRHSLGAQPMLSVTYLLPGQTGTWGTGCPIGTGTFAFAFVGAMVGGSTVQLAHSNGPADSIGVNYFALDLDALGTPLLPGCTLYLPPAQSWILGNVVLLDGAGNGSTSWPVPSSYPGLWFVSQSAALAATPLGIVTSNAGIAVIQ